MCSEGLRSFGLVWVEIRLWKGEGNAGDVVILRRGFMGSDDGFKSATVV